MPLSLPLRTHSTSLLFINKKCNLELLCWPNCVEGNVISVRLNENSLKVLVIDVTSFNDQLDENKGDILIMSDAKCESCWSSF